MNRELIRQRLHRAVEGMRGDLYAPAKAAYLQAVQQVPELVATESDPVLFWRCCLCNVDTAAQKLVAYWHHRLQLFGPKRAFLSLNDLSGLSGALSASDIFLLKSGLAALAPDDLQGCRVVVMDPMRSKNAEELSSSSGEENTSQETKVEDATSSEDLLSRMRCLFFCCHLAAAEERGIPKSTGLVIVKVDRILSPRDKVKYQPLSNLLESALPVSLRALHIVILPTNKGAARVFDDTLVPLIDNALPEFLRPLTAVTIVK